MHQSRGFGYLACHVVAPGTEAPIVSGFDVALVDDDRITDLFTVIHRRRNDPTSSLRQQRQAIFFFAE
ncbi:hypothetical protein [Mycobacterium sp. 852002-51961_SCH5331710]|uniref:hypothetical protein n=1 Tax=Mycobacterium sp. 852002-51961_SCH5331710 TaxID=1834105 RepID=UPI0008016C42|nr:hypothetical protein [Mycobacterium sp. 852002-51961_SCH5331710]OBB47451.1 hypothetical protein A5752_24265 [Mycobacterium sp. 852002-51961_SCH5331710]